MEEETSSADEIKGTRSKRLKLKEKEDLISALPDPLIHHILSFLPLTKQAIRTGVLSKRWRNQWTRVPVLIFDFTGIFSDFYDAQIYSMPRDMQSRLIDETLILHDCSKIKKFHLISLCNLQYSFTQDPISFAVRKEVEDLFLDLFRHSELPNSVFNLPSLVKLHVSGCTLMPNGRVNWKHLKDLHVEDCCWSNQAIESVVSGSPLLESLEINFCEGFDRLVIASKSLKKLVLVDLNQEFVLDVSCPNLVEFYARIGDFGEQFRFSHRAIENVLSGSPSLELLELNRCHAFEQLVIDSKSLRKLVLVETNTGTDDAIVISCPKLEELELYFLYMHTIKLTNLQSSICVTLDTLDDYSTARMILEQLHDIKELNIGPCFVKVLSSLGIAGVSPPSVNIKCLTFDGGPNFVQNLPGIAYGLRISPKLEKLVIVSQGSECPCETHCGRQYLHVSGENYWNSNGSDFNCLESHLKIVEIFVLSENNAKDKLNLVFNFIEFLLKNAKVLEKMFVILEHFGADFVLEVSQKLLSFPRYSRHAIVKLLCSEWPRTSKHRLHG